MDNWIEIEVKIKELEKRIEAGRIIREQCKRQAAILKKKLKEYRRILYELKPNYAADGDL